MNDGLECARPSYPTMEHHVGRCSHSSKGHERIVSGSQKKSERKERERKNACSVGDIDVELHFCGAVPDAGMVSLDANSEKNDVEREENEQEEGRETRRKVAEAVEDRLTIGSIEECR